uniref:Uncharacterized protein n=1 Tax=Rhizophora mucronata TaxID=61149 RepID=A0A2P2N0H1_RHIMU
MSFLSEEMEKGCTQRLMLNSIRLNQRTDMLAAHTQLHRKFNLIDIKGWEKMTQDFRYIHLHLIDSNHKRIHNQGKRH